MRKVFYILLVSFLFVQCEDRLQEEGSYFIFGRYNGFCMENCSQLYKYENGFVYEDDMNTVRDESELIFKEDANEEIDISSVEKLFNELPDELLEVQSKTYGCPGCLDQDIILVQYHDGKELSAWRLDSFTENMPENIAEYANRVLRLLDEM